LRRSSLRMRFRTRAQSWGWARPFFPRKRGDLGVWSAPAAPGRPRIEVEG